MSAADAVQVIDGVTLPTAEQLAAASEGFERDWAAVDKVLYEVCSDHPTHEDRSQVIAKLAIVGRTYSAGVERCVKPGPGQQGLMLIADHVWKHGGEVDDIFAAVHEVEEPLTPAGAQAIVEQHGRFAQLLLSMPECKRMPRSFAAKYLHFHHPVVPIYDSYVEIRLGKLVKWSKWKAPFEQPPHGDLWYWKYCVRFFRMYEVCHEHDLHVTVKTLDQFLWEVPA